MSEDHKFLRKIFSEAVEIADARGRADYIVQACGDNAALRQQIDVLIEVHETSWKFPNRAEVRRWKRTFAAVSVIAFAAIVGLMVSTWSLVKERKAREQAEVAERQQSQSISQFLSSMLSGTDLNQAAPRRDPGAMREILEDTTRRMRAEKDLPAAMSGSNAAWGDFSSAGEQSNTMSFLLQRQQFLVARSLEGLALVRIQQNELDAAAELFRDSWEIRKKLFAPGTAEKDSTDLPAQWRLRDAQAFRRASDMQRFGNSNEIAKVAQFHRQRALRLARGGRFVAVSGGAVAAF